MAGGAPQTFTEEVNNLREGLLTEYIQLMLHSSNSSPDLTDQTGLKI